MEHHLAAITTIAARGDDKSLLSLPFFLIGGLLVLLPLLQNLEYHLPQMNHFHLSDDLTKNK